MNTPTPLRPLLFALACALAALSAPSAEAAPCPQRAQWPTEDWPTPSSEVAAARAAEVRALEDYAFTLTGKDEERRGIRTDAVLIIQGGRLVYERYGRGYTAQMRHLAWSVTKTVTNALTGLAVARGAVTLEDSICRHLPLGKEALCRIRVQDLLEFSSGLDWKETYENQSNQVSSVLAMLYGEGRQDKSAFVASHRLRDAPGTTYAYSSGDSVLLAGVLDRALRPALGEAYPWTLLFDVLGMRSAALERDAAGVPVGSSYFYATPRDLAKLGFLYLNDGCWEGQRLLPEGWVAASTAVSTPFRTRPLNHAPGDVQGRSIWLNRPVPEQHVEKPWPSVPDDAFAARGHWGQSITVIPSLDMVVVRVADDRQKRALDFDRFLFLAIAVGR